jgi:hypothetical protein
VVLGGGHGDAQPVGAQAGEGVAAADHDAQVAQPGPDQGGVTDMEQQERGPAATTGRCPAPATSTGRPGPRC